MTFPTPPHLSYSVSGTGTATTVRSSIPLKFIGERNRRGSGPLEEPSPARLAALRLGWRGLTPRWPRSLRLGSASAHNLGARGPRAQALSPCVTAFWEEKMRYPPDFGISRFARWVRADQLQTPQCPTAQRHAGGIGPARRGPQRRTHSRATASVRSPMPPGQQPLNIADTSRSVSDSALLETDSMCATIPGSGWAGPMRPVSTRSRRGIRLPPRLRRLTDSRRGADQTCHSYAVCGTRATLSW